MLDEAPVVPAGDYGGEEEPQGCDEEFGDDTGADVFLEGGLVAVPEAELVTDDTGDEED